MATPSRFGHQVQTKEICAIHSRKTQMRFLKAVWNSGCTHGCDIPNDQTRHEDSMTKRYFALEVILAVAVLAISNIPLVGQQVPSSGTPVHMVVTVEAHHGTNIPAINREDVMVYQGHDRDQVTDPFRPHPNFHDAIIRRASTLRRLNVICVAKGTLNRVPAHAPVCQI